MKNTLLIILTMFFLTGCGQTGPLYLPGEDGELTGAEVVEQNEDETKEE